MVKEKVLTDEEIIELGKNAIEAGLDGYILPVSFARKIEQAILKSNQVQGWKRDSERFHNINMQHLVFYDYRRIGWELERTAMGEGFYGNALSVARDVPGLSEKELAVLDRYATGSQLDIDHVTLQDIAMKMYKISKPIDF